MLDSVAPHRPDEVRVIRHRLGGATQSFTRVVPAAGEALNPLDDEAERHAFTPAPGTEGGVPGVRRTKRRRKALYRRPLVIVPVVLLTIVVALAGTVIYRVNSTLESVHQISTIPPRISDSTYNDGDAADLGEPLVPDQIDTAPAREALRSSSNSRTFDTQNDSGFTARLANVAGTTGDIAQSAMAASGVSAGQGAPITLLVMGVDARPGAAIDIGVRPDAFMLVRLDPVSNSCRVLSVPRDTRVNLPGYGESKINHALMVGGIPYELMVAEEYLGFNIDHYLLVDFQAFEQMVDTVGGISVKVPTDLEKNGELRYKTGTYEFNGEETLAYARFRAAPDGDAGRVQRQWTILSALAKASANRTAAADVNTLLPQINEHIRTDLSVGQMVSITKQYGNVCRNMNPNAIKMIDGTRVRMSDPILNQTAYFNVVSEKTKEDRIKEFLGGVPAAERPAIPFPASSPSPSTPAATPNAVQSNSRLRDGTRQASTPC